MRGWAAGVKVNRACVCGQLVDLAGSEHRIDSAEHGAARRKEAAQINSSLAGL